MSRSVEDDWVLDEAEAPAGHGWAAGAPGAGRCRPAERQDPACRPRDRARPDREAHPRPPHPG